MATATDDQTMLGIYLNDHLAGSTGGADLAARLASAERHWAGGAELERLAKEIAEDRAALLSMMKALDVPIRFYKVVGAWIGEKLARLKFNGKLLARSPLSRLVELETLRLGVEGKAAGWRTLRVRADADGRLDSDRLDRLIDRALTQSEMLERLRVRAAAEVFDA